MQRSLRTWMVGVAAVAAVAAFTVVAVTRERGRDCESFRFDRAAWQGTRDDLRPERETRSEKTRRALADDLAGCGTLIGRSRQQVLAMLGRPDGSGAEGGAKPYAYVTYLVGYREQTGSSAEEFLFVELETAGRVVWVESPNGRVGNDVVTSGRRIDPYGG